MRRSDPHGATTIVAAVRSSGLVYLWLTAAVIALLVVYTVASALLGRKPEFEAGLALAGFFAAAHGLAQAAGYAGEPAVVPVGGVFRRWPFGQVGVGPELVEPGEFPSGFGVVRPAGPDLVGEVVDVLGAEDGFDPVG